MKLTNAGVGPFRTLRQWWISLSLTLAAGLVPAYRSAISAQAQPISRDCARILEVGGGWMVHRTSMDREQVNWNYVHWVKESSSLTETEARTFGLSLGIDVVGIVSGVLGLDMSRDWTSDLRRLSESELRQRFESEKFKFVDVKEVSADVTNLMARCLEAEGVVVFSDYSEGSSYVPITVRWLGQRGVSRIDVSLDIRGPMKCRQTQFRFGLSGTGDQTTTCVVRSTPSTCNVLVSVRSTGQSFPAGSSFRLWPKTCQPARPERPRAAIGSGRIQVTLRSGWITPSGTERQEGFTSSWKTFNLSKMGPSNFNGPFLYRSELDYATEQRSSDQTETSVTLSCSFGGWCGANGSNQGGVGYFGFTVEHPVVVAPSTRRRFTWILSAEAKSIVTAGGASGDGPPASCVLEVIKNGVEVEASIRLDRNRDSLFSLSVALAEGTHLARIHCPQMLRTCLGAAAGTKGETNNTVSYVLRLRQVPRAAVQGSQGMRAMTGRIGTLRLQPVGLSDTSFAGRRSSPTPRARQNSR